MKIETQVGLFIIIAIATFFYLSFSIGNWRLDNSSYFTYKAYFEDIGGLEKKSPVKIAGVTVGWVEDIMLTDNALVEVILKINRNHKLYRNSHLTMNQDGLLGSRTLEIDAGDSSSGTLAPGSPLPMPGKASTSVADIIERFKEITDSVQDVVSSFQSVFATPTGEKMIASTLDQTLQAAKQLNNFSSNLNDVVKENKPEINQICQSLNEASDNAKETINQLQDRVDTISTNIADASTSIKSGSKKFDRTLKNTQDISNKVAKGDGTLGLLVNDSSLYYDVKDTVVEVKNMVGKAGGVSSVIDGNFAQYYNTDNSRGSAEIKLAFYSDYFYTLQVSSDKIGRVSRSTKYNRIYDLNGNEILHTDPSFSMYERGRLPYKHETIIHQPDVPLLGFTINKKFNDLTVMLGMIDHTLGGGFEYDFGLRFGSARLITRVEAFDFKGQNRIEDDRRPHIRISNKLFFTKNIYTFFGMDDIISKQQSSFFWGAGIKIADDDIKYLFSFLPIGKLVAG